MHCRSAKAVTPTVLDAGSGRENRFAQKSFYVSLVSDVNGSPELILGHIEGYVRLKAYRMRVFRRRER